jgi:hypothetical protein
MNKNNPNRLGVLEGKGGENLAVQVLRVNASCLINVVVHAVN